MTRQLKTLSAVAAGPRRLSAQPYQWRHHRLPDLLVSWLTPIEWLSARDLPTPSAQQLQPLIGLASPDLRSVATLSFGRTSDPLDPHSLLASTFSLASAQTRRIKSESAVAAEIAGTMDEHHVVAAVHRVSLARGYAIFLATFSCPLPTSPSVPDLARALTAGLQIALNQQQLGSGVVRG